MRALLSASASKAKGSKSNPAEFSTGLDADRPMHTSTMWPCHVQARPVRRKRDKRRKIPRQIPRKAKLTLSRGSILRLPQQPKSGQASSSPAGKLLIAIGCDIMGFFLRPLLALSWSKRRVAMVKNCTRRQATNFAFCLRSILRMKGKSPQSVGRSRRW